MGAASEKAAAPHAVMAARAARNERASDRSSACTVQRWLAR